MYRCRRARRVPASQTRKDLMKKILIALSLLVAALLAAPAAQAAPGDAGTKSEKATVTWRDDAGVEHHARALTADEVKARGLDAHVDLSHYTMKRPTVRDATTRAPRQADGTRSRGVTANTCWSHWHSHGTNLLYGKTYVNWCGDGRWVRYTDNWCTGYANPAVPSYRFLRCSTHPQYGVGWNIYEVRSRWELCPGWQPLTGQCWVHDDPEQEWQYQGDGGVVKVG